MKKILFFSLFVILINHLTAQTYTEVRLWEKSKPTAYNISDTTEAAMYIYQPEPHKNVGVAIIVCPGGAYSGLAINHEGHQVGEWLASNGITGVVLKYRLPKGNSDVPISDVREATRYLRTMSDVYKIDYDKIGIMGFSAGGHLASTHLTLTDDSLSKPNFGVLYYPVITSDERFIHSGSFNNLLGENATNEQRKRFSNELNITETTPPVLLFHSNDDRVSPINSLLFYESLKEKEISMSSLYIFPNGGHGWGFRPQFTYHDSMKLLLLQWISSLFNLKNN